MDKGGEKKGRVDMSRDSRGGWQGEEVVVEEKMQGPNWENLLLPEPNTCPDSVNMRVWFHPQETCFTGCSKGMNWKWHTLGISSGSPSSPTSLEPAPKHLGPFDWAPERILANGKQMEEKKNLPAWSTRMVCTPPQAITAGLPSKFGGRFSCVSSSRSSKSPIPS